ncbi:hypothetical protein ACHAWF_001221, partial [Thalassiosira exigua]
MNGKGKALPPSLSMGDFNADMDNKVFAEFVAEHDLIDVVDEMNDGTPPRTYARGRRRLDYILCHRRLRRAIIKSGSIGLHDSHVFSDHTMQWVDFDLDLLFEEKVHVTKSPWIASSHFEKVIALAEEFKRLQNHELDSAQMIALVDRYHKLDKLIYDTIIDTANSTGKTDFGYQRSPALVQAGRLITFWKAVASSIRRRITLPKRMTRLASHLGIDPDHYQNIPHCTAPRKITDARRAKREIHKRDGKERAKWLDGEAQAKANENPTGPDWTVVKKQMIHAAHDRQMNHKLSGLFRRPHTPLDHILIPSEEWYYDPSANEFRFTDGLFRAYPRQGDCANMSFSPHSGLKTPPDDLRSVDVEVLDDELRCLTQQPTTPIAWEAVTDPVEIESWLAKRNKCHLQQVWADGSPA